MSRRSSGHAVSKDQVGGGLGSLPAGTRGSSGEASFKARGETGVRFLLTPDLEGILKRLWEVVARGSPLVSYHPSCPWRVTELVVESLAPQARGPGAWARFEEHVAGGVPAVPSTRGPGRGSFLDLDSKPPVVYFFL